MKTFLKIIGASLAGSATTIVAFYLFIPPKMQTPFEQTQSKDPLIEIATKEINKAIRLKPIEFSCNIQFGCSIPETSRKWTGLDYNSACIWIYTAGSGAIQSRVVTQDGVHVIDENADSVLCQNDSGEVFFGTKDTKIVPTEQDLEP